MTILHQDSFNGYADATDLSVTYNTFGNLTINKTGGRYGGGSLSSSGGHGIVNSYHQDTHELWFGWAIECKDTIEGSIAAIFSEQSDSIIELGVFYNPASGFFSFKNAGGTIIASGTKSLSPNTYYWIEIRVAIGAVSDGMELWIDGIQVITHSGGSNPLGGTLIKSVGIGGASYTTGHSLIAEHCHWYVLDTKGSRNNTRKGDGKFVTLYPVRDAFPNNGVPSSPTPNHYLMVDERYIDFKESTIFIDSLGKAEVFAYGPSALSNQEIHSVKIWNVAKSSLEGVEQSAAGIKVGSILNLRKAVELGSDDTSVSGIWETDPSTGDKWNVIGIDSIRAGCIITPPDGSVDLALLSSQLSNLTLSATVSHIVGATASPNLEDTVLMARANHKLRATLSTTLGRVTLLSSATHQSNASVSKTLGNVVLASTMVHNTSVTLSSLFDNVTLVAAANSNIGLTLSATLGSIDIFAVATQINTARMSQTLAGVFLSSTATRAASVAVSQVLEAISSLANSNHSDNATVTKTLASIAISSTATHDNNAVLSKTFDLLSLAATAMHMQATASLSSLFDPLVLSSSTNHSDLATLSKTLDPVSLVSVANHIDAYIDLTATLDALILSSTSTNTDKAILSKTLLPLSLVATVNHVAANATLAKTLSDSTLSAAIRNPARASLSQTLSTLSMSSTAIHKAVNALVAKTLSNDTLASALTDSNSATLSRTLGTLTVNSAIGHQSAHAVLAQTFNDSTLSSAVVHNDIASLIRTLAPLTIVSSAVHQAVNATSAKTLNDATLVAAIRNPDRAIVSSTLNDAALAATIRNPDRALVSALLSSSSLSSTVRNPVRPTLSKTLDQLTLSSASNVSGAALTVVHNQEFDTFSGHSWGALTADLNDSLLWDQSAGEFRFEVRNGERYQTMAFSDPPYTMRSEWYCVDTFPFDTDVTFSFSVMVEHGQEPTTNQWFIIGQHHVGTFVGTGGSPPIALDVRPNGTGGEKLQVDLNYHAIGAANITYTNIGNMPNFQRGVWYDCVITFRDGQGDIGYARVDIGGTTITEYFGITGYEEATSPSYPKFGIYTGGNGSSATTLPLPGQDIVVRYRNVTYAIGSSPSISVVPAKLIGNHKFTSGIINLPPSPSGGKQHRFSARVTTPSSTTFTTPLSNIVTVPIKSYPAPTGSGTTQVINSSMNQATITSAVNAAGIGGVVIMLGGTYANKRINPLLNQIFMADYGATVVMTGSIPITGWVTDTIYYRASGFPPNGYTPGDSTWVGSRGVVALIPNDLYWNGVPYLRVNTQGELGAGKFWVDTSHVVWVTDNPTGVTTTASSTDHAFFGGADPLSVQPAINGVVLQQIHAKEYATPSSRGIFQFEGTTSLTLVDCQATWAHACGVLCQYADIYGGDYSHNGQQGILAYGAASYPATAAGGSVVSITCNYNNWAGYSPGNGAGGWKSLLLTGPIIKYSEFSHNIADGVWFDTNCTGTVEYNTIADNYTQGFHQEDSRIGVTLITGNLFDRNCTDGNSATSSVNFGTQIFPTSSSGVSVTFNTVIVSATQGAYSLSEDPRSNAVTNCNFSNNTIINLGTSFQAGVSNGESSPPIYAGTNTWNNNAYFLPSSGSYSWLWNSIFYNDSSHAGSAIEGGSTFSYGASPLSRYLASFASVAPTGSIDELILPGGAKFVTGFSTKSGLMIVNGSWRGPDGSTVDLIIETF